MNKTLVKTKIVLDNEGKGLTIYMWKKIFWIFGYWYVYGNSGANCKYTCKKINRINDDEMHKILIDKFILGWD